MSYQATNLVFAGKSVATTLVLSLLLCSISLLLGKLVKKSDVDLGNRNGADRTFQGWIVRHFAKLTLIGLLLGSIIYPISLVLVQPTRFTHRLLFLAIVFAGPVFAFLDVVLRVTRIARR